MAEGKNNNYRAYITIGALLWIGSICCEAFKLQPYSTIGLILSPLTLGLGIFQWLKSHKSRKGHYPSIGGFVDRLEEAKKEGFLAPLAFMLGYILEFWTFIIIFWMWMMLGSFLSLAYSGAFGKVREYCESNPEILEKTGDIQYYGFLLSGKISQGWDSGDAEFSFTIVGEHGNFDASAELVNTGEGWDVTEIEVK